jgi:hypothetical protein
MIASRDAGGPDRLVVAERHRGAGPIGRGFGEPHGRPQMAQAADGRIAVDRPAVDVGLRDFVRHVLERRFGHFAAVDQPAAGLRQRDAHEPAAAFAGAACQRDHRANAIR